MSGYVTFAKARRHPMPVTDALLPLVQRWRWLWELSAAALLAGLGAMEWRDAGPYARSLAESAFDDRDGWWLGQIPHPRDAVLEDMEHWEG